MLQEFFFYSQPATSVDAVIKICDVCSIDKISCSKSLLFYCGSTFNYIYAERSIIVQITWFVSWAKKPMEIVLQELW